MASLKTLMEHWRYVGVAVGVTLGLLLVAVLTFPERNTLVAKGPMNTGHEGLACQDCHIAVQGTKAQQMSSSVYHWLGLRDSAIGFGSEDVESAVCLDCHDRPDDRHPISRFLEPRFEEQRMQIMPHMCITCHREHQGVRVTQTTIGYCTHCHQDTALENDPIFPPHEELVRDGAFNTCLQCHDFHGNHIWDTPVSIDDGVPEHEIWRYFAGGPSPYGDEKHVEPKTSRENGEP